jgi:acyl-coenzyme A thioesterase PaaI-like protein
MQELPHTRSCFVCGESNPQGLKLRFHTDGQVVTAAFRPRAEHIGFKGVVHGGITATVLDEIMVWACAVATRKFAFCAEMCVRYLQPLVPDQEYILRGKLAEDRKGRIFRAEAAVEDPTGKVMVTATGKYLPLPDVDSAKMAQDFVGDPSWLAESKRAG